MSYIGEDQHNINIIVLHTLLYIFHVSVKLVLDFGLNKNYQIDNIVATINIEQFHTHVKI